MKGGMKCNSMYNQFVGIQPGWKQVISLDLLADGSFTKDTSSVLSTAPFL